MYPFLPPANEVCKGNVFTGVCPSAGVSVWGFSVRKTPLYGKERAVRILLECILVRDFISHNSSGNSSRVTNCRSEWTISSRVMCLIVLYESCNTSNNKVSAMFTGMDFIFT